MKRHEAQKVKLARPERTLVRQQDTSLRRTWTQQSLHSASTEPFCCPHAPQEPTCSSNDMTPSPHIKHLNGKQSYAIILTQNFHMGELAVLSHTITIYTHYQPSTNSCKDIHHLWL